MSKPPAVFCALDRPDLEGALALGRSLVDVVGGLKVGLEFVTANGPEGVRRVVDLGLPVFLDVKFHDIPNTVARAVGAAGALGVAMLNLHVAGGPAMLRAAVAVAESLRPRPWLLGVTVLTSMDDRDLAALGIGGSTSDQALRLAELARTCQLDGVVCSPHEIVAVRRRCGADFKLVVPGIRPQGRGLDDQKRTMSPAEAAAIGADVLVIGRPITQALDPRAAARAITAEIAAALAA
jgi:orotidine-5'-phosphate decarboxylase